MGCSPWGRKELDTTERLTHTHTHTRVCVCVCVCVYMYIKLYMLNIDIVSACSVAQSC